MRNPHNRKWKRAADVRKAHVSFWEGISDEKSAQPQMETSRGCAESSREFPSENSDEEIAHPQAKQPANVQKAHGSFKAKIQMRKPHIREAEPDRRCAKSAPELTRTNSDGKFSQPRAGPGRGCAESSREFLEEISDEKSAHPQAKTSCRCAKSSCEFLERNLR